MNLTALLIPTSLDAKQVLRLHRFGFAALSYALCAALTAAAWAFGIVPALTAVEMTGAYLAINLGLYAVFRSGFNLRFKDPSLTRFQILVAITALMYLIYHMDSGRNVVLLACFIVFPFGVFSLSTREFTVVTLYTLGLYALVIILLMHLRPHAIQNVPLEWMSWLMLAVILPCFAAIGGRINALRLKLREREARFRSLTQLSSDFYWETDAGHRMVAVAHGAQHRAVLPKGSHIGKTRWELPHIHPDEAGWAAHRATLDAHLMFRDFELGRLGPDRKERHLSISGEPMFDQAGGFKGYRGIGRDITVRKRAEQLLGLEHTVARCMSEADSAAAGIQAVIRAICESENWEIGRYWRVDEAAGVLRFGGCWGAAGAEMELALGDSHEVVFAPGAGVAGRVWQSGQPLWIADTTNDPRVVRKNLASNRGLRGVFVFPVMSEGKTIGVLAISSREVRKPDERLLVAVKVIGSQVGQFLQRKQAEQAIAHQAMQQGLIAAFGQQALASTNLDELLDQAVVVAGKGLDAGFCRVLQPGPDGSSLVVKAGSGWTLDRAGRRIDETDSMSKYSYVLASREPVAIEDFALETRFAPSGLLAAHGIRSGVEGQATLQNLCTYPVALGAAPALDGTDPLLEFIVGFEQRTPEVIEPRPDNVRGLVPTLRAGFERFVVALFRILEDALQADVAPHGVVEVIKQLQGEQPRHPPVAIRMPFDNVVIGCFPMPTGLRHVAVQGTVQLKDGSLRERHMLGAFVYQSQRIPVGRIIDAILGSIGVLNHTITLLFCKLRHFKSIASMGCL